MGAQPQDRIGAELREGYINTKNAVTQYNRALIFDEGVEEAKGALHLSVINFFLHMRPWLQTKEEFWRKKRVMRKPDLRAVVDEDEIEKYDEGGSEEDSEDGSGEDKWVTGLANLDKWVMSVEKKPERENDAIEGESDEYEEVAHILPAPCALQAARALDAAFQQSPWAPRSMKSETIGELQRDDVYSDDIPQNVQEENNIGGGGL